MPGCEREHEHRAHENPEALRSDAERHCVGGVHARGDEDRSACTGLRGRARRELARLPGLGATEPA